MEYNIFSSTLTSSAYIPGLNQIAIVSMISVNMAENEVTFPKMANIKDDKKSH